MFKKFLLMSLLFTSVWIFPTSWNSNNKEYEINYATESFWLFSNWLFLSSRKNDTLISQILRAGGQLSVANSFVFVQKDKERAKLSLLGGVAAIILGNCINSEPVKNNMIGSVQDVAQTAITPASIRGSWNVALRAKNAQNQFEKNQAVNELCCYAALFLAGKIVYELISPKNNN